MTQKQQQYRTIDHSIDSLSTGNQSISRLLEIAETYLDDRCRSVFVEDGSGNQGLVVAHEDRRITEYAWTEQYGAHLDSTHVAEVLRLGFSPHDFGWVDLPMVKGVRYDLSRIEFVAWIQRDDASGTRCEAEGTDGYTLCYYFDDDGIYQGADCHGIEPSLIDKGMNPEANR